MKPRINANFKIDPEKYEFLQGLVSTGTYRSLSEIYRLAVDEFIAKYTDIPTLLSLDRRVKLNKAQIDKLSESDRNQNRHLAGLQRDVEGLKK